MFEIEKNLEFSAAHRLCGYHGDCRELHGHNYQITAVLRARELDEIGIAVDFKKLKAALDEILLEYDHTFLNELPDFSGRNPTSEVIAMVIYRRLSEKLNSENVRVHKIRIHESPSSCATYFEE